MFYTSTTGNDTWQLEVLHSSYNGKQVLSDSSKSAVISPAFPFIAIPIDDFANFKNLLSEAHPETNLVCSNFDWCYFMNPCSKMEEHVLPFEIQFGDSTNNKTFSISPKQFMISDIDARTELSICHLAIVGQKWASSFDHIQLGESFIKGRYIVFDASNPDQPQVGIQYKVPEPRTLVDFFLDTASSILDFLF